MPHNETFRDVNSFQKPPHFDVLVRHFLSVKDTLPTARGRQFWVNESFLTVMLFVDVKI